MRAEEHRELRLALGALALGDLPAADRAAVEGHLRECAECREELAGLESVGRLLSLADPDRVSQPAPRPPRELGTRIEAAIAAERRTRRVGRRRRFALAALAGAAAIAAALVLLVGGGGTGPPSERVEFGSLPSGVEIGATLVPRSFGTEIHMYVSGIRSGTLCRVFLRDSRGRSFSAGSFRYRWDGGSEAVLSSALDLSRADRIAVRAGARTFVAAIGQGAGAATWKPTEEEA